MADTVLKIFLEGGEQVETGLQDVSKAYVGVGVAAKKSGEITSKSFKETTEQGQKLNETLKNGVPKIDFKKPTSELARLKAEVKDLTSKAIKAGEGTKEFARLLALAGAKKADIKDLQQAIAALDPDVKAKAFLQLSQTIITGFAAGTGALAAFGVSTEDAEKTLVKLQAAMAFGQFLGQLGELGDTFRVLQIQIRNSEIAQKAFNLVSKANPYVLIASAIAVAAGAIFAFNDTTEENTITVDKNSDAYKENEERIKKSTEAREKLKLEIEDLTLKILKESGALSDRQFELAKVQKESDRALLESRKETLKELGLTEEDAIFKSVQLTASEQFQKLAFEEKFAENSKLLIEKKAKQDEEINTRFNNIDSENFKKTNEKKKTDQQKYLTDLADAQRKLNESAGEELLESEKKLEEKRGEVGVAAIENIKDLNKEKLDDTKEANEDIVENEKKTAEELQRIREQGIQAAISVGQELFSFIVQNGKNETEIKLRNLEEQKNNDIISAEEYKKRRSQILTDQFEKEKGAKIIETIINTAVAITKASPNIALMAAAAAIGLIQTAKISAQPTPQFAEGGYTGDGGKWDEAGTVHKGEYVMTKDKTEKHRLLFDKIHNDESISLLDLAPLLKGTGVGLLPDVIPSASKQMESYGLQKLYQQESSDKNIKELNENFKKFLNQQGTKESRQTLADGTEIIRKGNTIRIIKKKK